MNIDHIKNISSHLVGKEHSNYLNELELLKKKNHKKIINAFDNITTKEPVDIEKTFKITFEIIEDLKKMEKYIHLEETNENFKY